MRLPPGSREPGLRHGHKVAHVDVPRAGDDLQGRGLAHVDKGDEHVVGIRVLFDGEDLAHHDVLYLGAQVLGGLLLGAGQGHGLGKVAVAGVHLNEFVEPFS
jgi:hypothetical protein